MKAAEKRRQEIEALAQAEKFRQEMEGSGRASAIRSVGEAEASAIKAKSEALQGEGADKQLMQTVMLRLAEAFETAKVPLVPQIQLGGGSDGNAFSTLMSLMGSLKALELSQSQGARGSRWRAEALTRRYRSPVGLISRGIERGRAGRTLCCGVT